MAQETRNVVDFDRIVVRDYGQLIVTQGSEESLTIEADEEILPKIEAQVVDRRLELHISGTWLDKMGDVLRSGLSGKWVKYMLTVKELSGLEVSGALSATVTDIQTDRLALRLRGAGSITVKNLGAEELIVDLPGAGAVKVSGKVSDQRIALSGAGSYSAMKLESQRASVDLSGAGSATVWAVDDLKSPMSPRRSQVWAAYRPSPPRDTRGRRHAQTKPRTDQQKAVRILLIEYALALILAWLIAGGLWINDRLRREHAPS